MADASAASSSAEELRLEGNAALSRKDQKRAHLCYTRAIELSPHDHILFSNRAAANANMGRWQEALEDSQRCISLAPEWAKGHTRAGAAYYALGQFTDAVGAYTKSLELVPHDSAVEHALEDARKAEAKKQVDAELMPAVLKFAQRKQAGQKLINERNYAAAATEYRQAIKSMSELMEKLPSSEGEPMRMKLLDLKRSMEAELVGAVQRQEG